MNVRSSFSQHETFEGCKRQWYYSYVKKLPQVSDMSYADRGTIVHDILENWYSNKYTNIDEAKVSFQKSWEKYKLDDSFLKLKKDETWLMIINGINLHKKVTSTELKIYYPEIIAYLDVVNTDDDELSDWKSSTRREENEASYKKQLTLYSWLYKRKIGRIPKKCTVEYLKYEGSKGQLIFSPTEEEIQHIEEWYNNILIEMDKVKKEGKVPPMCKECTFFCPYKNLCGTSGVEDLLKWTLHIFGNYIKIDGPITKLLDIGLTKKFSYELKNAYFMKKANPHANTIIKFWNLNHRSLPIGFMKGLVKTLTDYAKYKKMEFSLDIEDHRQFNEDKIEMPDKFVNGKELRDYQLKAVDKFLREKIALFELATGAGKTEIAIELIRRLGVKTLFIVDRKELMLQTKNRIQDSLGIEVGQLGSGIDDVKDITVCTIQTIIQKFNVEGCCKIRKNSIRNNRWKEQNIDDEKQKKKFINEYVPTKEESNEVQQLREKLQTEKTALVCYLRSVRFCIYDECHHVSAASYQKISQQLTNTEYRLLMSGTAYRDDGNDMMIHAIGGTIAHSLDSQTLIDKGWLMKPQIKFYKDYMPKDIVKRFEDEAKKGLINETPNYSNYYNVFITTNQYRNELIKKIIEQNKDKKILMLVKLVEHGNSLEDDINGSKYLHGSTGKKEREEIFEDFTKGNLNILISTISIFAEGIDIPQLDMVINVSANKGEVKSIQVLGRVLRKMEGKTNAQYIDFIDETKFFRLASLARKKAFYKEGHNVEVLNYENV